jgi:uncharacterized protein YndB with AHSA1/START domain
MSTETAQATQVYRVSIDAPAERIWEAITRPEWSAQYFFGARVTFVPDRYESIGPEGDMWVEGEVEEFDPPRRLVHGWRSYYDPAFADEPASRVTWDIEEQPGGGCLLTVTHDRLEASPKTAAGVSGGWQGIVDRLKELVETGAVTQG